MTTHTPEPWRIAYERWCEATGVTMNAMLESAFQTGWEDAESFRESGGIGRWRPLLEAGAEDLRRHFGRSESKLLRKIEALLSEIDGAEKEGGTR